MRARALVLALALALALGACAADPIGPCALTMVADLPAFAGRQATVVTAKVNGTDTRMIVDTGGAKTMLTDATITALQLPRSKLFASHLGGVGGETRNLDVFATVTLGAATFDQRIAVANMTGIGGLVGADMLSGYDVEFDLPHRHVRLYHATGRCLAADLPWTGPRAAIPFDIDAVRHIILPVTLDGARIDALLDSGSATSIVTADTARRTGVTREAIAADPVAQISGIDGAVVAIHTHRFGALTVGETHIDSPVLGVGELHFGKGEMLLGADFLRRRRVWVSYGSGWIFVQVRPHDDH